MAEKKLTPKEAAVYFETSPTGRAVLQWMTLGVRDRTKPRAEKARIYLQSIREGGIIVTTEKWIQDFKDACNSNKKVVRHEAQSKSSSSGAVRVRNGKDPRPKKAT